MSVLERILERKRHEVARLHDEVGEDVLVERVRRATPPRGFGRALREGPAPRVIAEFKRASPSKGIIRKDADPADIARRYARAGASALSVLTDHEFFAGELDDLVRARGACSLPVLRKDFTLDRLQILEARGAGADAILLIVAVLRDGALSELIATAGELGIDALVEVHTAAELEFACGAGAEIIGINNRDLHSFKTDLSVTRELMALAGDRTIVSESGLETAEQVAELTERGVQALLVGEALMRDADPGEALRRLRGVR